MKIAMASLLAVTGMFGGILTAPEVTACQDEEDGCQLSDCTGNPPGEGIYVGQCTDAVVTGTGNTVTHYTETLPSCLMSTAPNDWEECTNPDN